MARFLVFALAILILPVLAKLYGANPPLQISPDNAVEILYTHVKRVDYRPLLELTINPEKKRITSLLQTLETNRAFSTELRRRAELLIGYKIHVSEIHDTVAAIMFTWRYRNDYKAPQPGINNPTSIESGCEALLIKEGNAWKLAATRPWVPENERGSVFLQQQYNSRINQGRR